MVAATARSQHFSDAEHHSLCHRHVSTTHKSQPNSRQVRRTIYYNLRRNGDIAALLFTRKNTKRQNKMPNSAVRGDKIVQIPLNQQRQ